MRPLLEGRAERPGYGPLFGEHEGGRSVLTADGWKLLKDRGENEWRLYDLNVDQTEMTDLAAREPARVTAMRALWEAWATENGVLPKP